MPTRVTQLGQVVDAAIYSNIITVGGIYLMSTFNHDTRRSVLWKTENPLDQSKWRALFVRDNCISPPKGLHRTSEGTTLWSPGDGYVYRSTSNRSFHKCLDLTNGYYVWDFTENGDGTILAGNYGIEPRIYKSLDDGATWHTLAGSKVFDFPTHVHKVSYNPHNDWIVVTGGDAVKYYYRSIDGGDTWDKLQVPCQTVGITFHPSHPDVYFLGGDYQSPPIWWYYHTVGAMLPQSVNRLFERLLWLPTRIYQSEPLPSGGFPGVYRIRDRGGPNISCVKVLSTDRGGMGSFVLRTIKIGGGWRYLVGTSSGGQPNSVVRFWLSQGPSGERWIPLTQYRGDGSHCLTTVQGANNRMYTEDWVPKIIANSVGFGSNQQISSRTLVFCLRRLNEWLDGKKTSQYQSIRQ